MMKGMSPIAFALAVAVFAGPAVAETTLVIPAPSAPKIATEGQALAALHARGVSQVRHIGLVGDYWEGMGIEGGRPVVAYVFDNGAIETHPASADELQQAFLPPTG